MTRAQWPEAHDVHLKQCWNNDLTYSETASSLNALFSTSYTRNAVIGRAARLGLNRFDRPRRAKEAQPARQPQTRKPKLAPPPIAPAIDLEHSDPIDLPGNNGALITLLDLKPGQFRYPFGEGPFHFCGEPQCGEGQAYCAEHYRLTRRQPEMRR